MLFNYPPTVCHTRLIYALLNLFIFCDFSPVACNNNLTAEKDAMLTTEDGGGVVMGDCSFFISQHTNTHTAPPLTFMDCVELRVSHESFWWLQKKPRKDGGGGAACQPAPPRRPAQHLVVCSTSSAIRM